MLSRSEMIALTSLKSEFSGMTVSSILGSTEFKKVISTMDEDKHPAARAFLRK